MVDTKSLDQTQKNWEDSHGRVPAAYSAGVQNAKDVIAKGVAAEDLWAQKVQEAIASKKRARKLAEVSDEQWRQAALEKGAPRIAAGMAASKQKFNTGMAKVLSVIQGVTIAPRQADPMANVDNRVKPIVAALAKMNKNIAVNKSLRARKGKYFIKWKRNLIKSLKLK